MLVPLRYPLRSIAVRWRSSVFSAFGIACTVGVLAAILALRDGFDSLYLDAGSDEVVVYMRPGATSEGESGIRLDQVKLLETTRPEVARDGSGKPIAAGECYLAINLERVGGGTTNVPIRGIREESITIQGSNFQIDEGRLPQFGADEIIVGSKIPDRISRCRVGDELIINLTPFKVVGTFRHPGAYGSEIWGDADRIAEALDRPFRQRVIARLKPGVDVGALKKDLEKDLQTPATVMTEREYFNGQTKALGTVIAVLAVFISSIMGIAAVLGATTTMLASIGSRTREIGILLALGFSRGGIFLAFLIEAILIGGAGGLLGCLGVLPFNGIETGTTNWQTFTEVAFAFRVGGGLLLKAFVGALLLGLLGGVAPAIRAARMMPMAALRRH